MCSHVLWKPIHNAYSPYSQQGYSVDRAADRTTLSGIILIQQWMNKSRTSRAYNGLDFVPSYRIILLNNAYICKVIFQWEWNSLTSCATFCNLLVNLLVMCFKWIFILLQNYSLQRSEQDYTTDLILR